MTKYNENIYKLVLSRSNDFCLFFDDNFQGLKKENEFCNSNDECDSGLCHYYYCTCTRLTPIRLEPAGICIESNL